MPLLMNHKSAVDPVMRRVKSQRTPKVLRTSGRNNVCNWYNVENKLLWRCWLKNCIFAVCVMLLCAETGYSAREQNYPDADSPHFLYLPGVIDSARTYWVVVGVHGAGGRSKGANGMAGWVDKKDNVIVLGPKFSDTYQNAGPEDEKLLIELFEKIQKDYKVHSKMFIYGFSGGSQFAHRFVMKRPEYVCGLSSHSGGSWATDGFGEINEKAKCVPMTVSCGEKDLGKAWGEAPYNRLEWYKRFEKELEKKEFFYRGNTWTNVGHTASKGVWEMTEECFQLATTGILPGSDLAVKLAEAERLAGAGEFDKAQQLKNELTAGSVALSEDSGWHESKEVIAIRRDLVNSALAGIDTSPAVRRRFDLYKRCVQLLKSGDKPDADALLSFMRQCAPSYWRGKEDEKLVFEACEAAATSHVAKLREQKQLNMQAYQNLINLFDGLAVGAELMGEYNAEASKSLEKVLAMKDGPFKQRALQAFIQQWRFGEAVSKARAELK